MEQVTLRALLDHIGSLTTIVETMSANIVILNRKLDKNTAKMDHVLRTRSWVEGTNKEFDAGNNEKPQGMSDAVRSSTSQSVADDKHGLAMAGPKVSKNALRASLTEDDEFDGTGRYLPLPLVHPKNARGDNTRRNTEMADTDSDSTGAPFNSDWRNSPPSLVVVKENPANRFHERANYDAIGTIYTPEPKRKPLRRLRLDTVPSSYPNSIQQPDLPQPERKRRKLDAAKQTTYPNPTTSPSSPSTSSPPNTRFVSRAFNTVDSHVASQRPELPTKGHKNKQSEKQKEKEIRDKRKNKPQHKHKHKHKQTADQVEKARAIKSFLA